MADLKIIVEVANNQTVSHFSIPASGKLVFMNGAVPTAGDLVITPKSTTAPLPFCDMNGTTPKQPSPIAPGKFDTFKLCNGATGRFEYAAQIGQAMKEDPIVIIEKKAKFVFDPGSFALGVGIAAVLTYLIVRALAGKTRPQQG